MTQNNYYEKFQRGYNQNLEAHETKEFRRRFLKRPTWPATPLALLYILSILIFSYAACRLNEYISYPLRFFVWPLALLMMARQMRALENVVHFGSHNTFSRTGWLNDLICNVVAGWPLLQSVAHYRRFHHVHHGHYGSEKDPCKSRFAMMADRRNLRTTRDLLFAVARWMPAYIKSYYADIGTRGSTLVCFAAWHLAVFAAISQLASLSTALHMLLVWGIAFLFVLPVIRSIAEYGEHDYARGTTVFSTTYSNLSLLDRLIFHPVGDAYHLLHHLFPTIPWWLQKEAHEYLIGRDKNYATALYRHQFRDKASEIGELA